VGLAVGVVNGMLYAVGGTDRLYAHLKKVEAFNPG
jgi:hypothetical protein